VQIHDGNYSVLCKLYGKNHSEVIEKAIKRGLEERNTIPDEIVTKKCNDFIMT
jgi:hypothetical protein